MKRLFGTHEAVEPLFAFILALAGPENGFPGRWSKQLGNLAFAKVHREGAIRKSEGIPCPWPVVTYMGRLTLETRARWLAWLNKTLRTKAADKTFRLFVVAKQPSLSARVPPGLCARS